MRRIIVVVAGALCLIAPLAAAAETLVPIAPAPEQLLAREAFLKTYIEGVPVACAIKTSKSAVKIDEPFMLWWGSYGAEEGGWSPTGAYTIVAAKSGTYEYKLVFRAQGASATCRTTISVS